MYRKAGKKVFLATNSLWGYTNVVMNFLVHGLVGSNKTTAWLDVRPIVLDDSCNVVSVCRLSLCTVHCMQCHSGGRIPSRLMAGTSGLQEFDVVITGCGKPAFFSEGGVLFAVNPADGTLANTDNGAPILQIDQADKPTSMPMPAKSNYNSVRVSPARGCCAAADLSAARARIAYGVA